MRQLKVEILRISFVLMDFFYRRSQDSTYTRTPHALRNNASRLNLTIPKRGCLEIAFETASFSFSRLKNNLNLPYTKFRYLLKKRRACGIMYRKREARGD